MARLRSGEVAEVTKRHEQEKASLTQRLQGEKDQQRVDLTAIIEGLRQENQVIL